MKSLFTLVLGVGLVALLSLTARADDKGKKEVTLKGTITCGKCDLKMADDCANVIKVTEKVDGKDKDVVYWLKDEGKSEKYHGKICQSSKKGSVTGVVSEKDGKKYITPTDKDSVKFD